MKCCPFWKIDRCESYPWKSFVALDGQCAGWLWRCEETCNFIISLICWSWHFVKPLCPGRNWKKCIHHFQTHLWAGESPNAFSSPWLKSWSLTYGGFAYSAIISICRQPHLIYLSQSLLIPQTTLVLAMIIADLTPNVTSASITKSAHHLGCCYDDSAVSNFTSYVFVGGHF